LPKGPASRSRGTSSPGQLVVSSADMTLLPGTLEWRGLAGRRPHPTDRRKKLIHLTGGAQDIADQMLPAIHTVIAHAISDLPSPTATTS